MLNSTNDFSGIFIPSEIAVDQSLSWNEKAVYSIFHYFTFRGELHCCKLTNESIAQRLGIGCVRTLRRIKSDLSHKGLISIRGITVTALKEYSTKTILSPTNKDTLDLSEGTEMVSKEDTSDLIEEDTIDPHNKKDNKTKEELFRGESESILMESTDQPDSLSDSQVAPLPQSPFEDIGDNSVVYMPCNAKYTNRKDFWEAWHSFKDGNNTKDNLQDLLENARSLGIQSDLAVEYGRTKGNVNTPKTTGNTPWVRLADNIEYNLVVSPNFDISKEYRPVHQEVFGKEQAIQYAQNASELLRVSEVRSPQYTATYLKAYLLEFRTLIASLWPDSDNIKRDQIAIRVWNRCVSDKYQIDTLCGVRP